MPGTHLKVKLDQRQLDALLGSTTDASAKVAAQRVRDRARDNLTRQDRIRTGALRDSIRIHVTEHTPKGSVYSVGSSLPYAMYQEEGVNHPIYPVKAKVLRFKPKGSSVFIFRAWTRGFPGAHYLRDAYRSLTIRDFVP